MQPETFLYTRVFFSSRPPVACKFDPEGKTRTEETTIEKGVFFHCPFITTMSDTNVCAVSFGSCLSSLPPDLLRCILDQSAKGIFSLSVLCYYTALRSVCASLRTALPPPFLDSWLKCRVLRYRYRAPVYLRHQKCAYLYADLAFNGYLGLLKWLRVLCWPQDLDSLSFAARNGQLSFIQYELGKGHHYATYPLLFRASKGGHIHVLEWVLANNLPYDTASQQSVLEGAGKGCRIHVLKWALGNKPKLDTFHVCTLRRALFKGAGKHGHVHALEWARVNGYCDGNMYEYLCMLAAQHGHLHVLCWAIANGFSGTDKIASAAASGGRLNVIRWARANGYDITRCCVAAADSGRLDTLQWLRANNYPWSTDVCSAAATNGHLESLKWARANGCSWDEQTCIGAAEGGHLDVLQWAHANGCGWNEATCAAAAGGGYLEVLQWLRAAGCPWDNSTCYAAEVDNHLEVLKWARANGCP